MERYPRKLALSPFAVESPHGEEYQGWFQPICARKTSNFSMGAREARARETPRMVRCADSGTLSTTEVLAALRAQQ